MREVFFFSSLHWLQQRMDSLSTRRFLRYAEYGLLVLIIGLIALFFLNRVQEVHRNAERMAIMGEINALRGGTITLLHPPEENTAEDLRAMNPVQLLETPPENYIGLIRNPREREIPPGSWYFFPDRGVLVYRARFAHDFPFTNEPTRRLRFTIEPKRKANLVPEQRVLACGPHICLTAQ